MSKTDELIKVGGLKLNEFKIQLGEDKKRLEELTGQRGLILASELIESKPGQKEQVKKLNKAISLLKITIEDSSPIISGLKAKLLSLKAQKEREYLQKAKDNQSELEKRMNRTSTELIKVLEQADKLNSKLRGYWASWTELTVITGKAMSDLKVSLGSEEMLSLCVSTILAEWQGKGHRVRDFYNRIKL